MSSDDWLNIQRHCSHHGWQVSFQDWPPVKILLQVSPLGKDFVKPASCLNTSASPKGAIFGLGRLFSVD